MHIETMFLALFEIMEPMCTDCALVQVSISQWHCTHSVLYMYTQVCT